MIAQNILPNLYICYWNSSLSMIATLAELRQTSIGSNYCLKIRDQSFAPHIQLNQKSVVREE